MNIEELIENYNQQKKQFLEIMEQNLSGYFADLLNKYPEVTAFQWAQYTPYFNDGEPCVFGLHVFRVRFQDTSDQENDEFLDAWDTNDSKKRKIIKKLEEVRDMIGPDVLKHIFGDHVRITVTRDGIDTDAYDHD